VLIAKLFITYVHLCSTIQNGEQKHLFVGFDSTVPVGLRGPTNLFGHPTDQLLAELDLELSQWNSQSTKPVTKISFGHFPLSFSAPSYSGKSLKDIFLKHSLSAYLCGHLHYGFGKNLKHHHQSSHHFLSLPNFFQFNIHQVSSGSDVNCSFGAPQTEEFWEWEMGDWRKSRAMRILAIDRGHVSYVDIDFKSGTKETIILPTFPLDSRFMSTFSLLHKYECQVMLPSSYDSVRALVFSVSPIVSVTTKIYDTRPGSLSLVMETSMTKLLDNTSRGDLYAAPWNYKAFEDPSPDRFWLQIEATDILGRSTLTELKPFSVNGLNAKISWTWKEFFVMGCQLGALYYPIFWFALYFMFSILLIPKALLIFSKKQYTYKNFIANKGFLNGTAWVLQELCRLPIVWYGMLGYLFHLILFPWFFGQVLTDAEDRGYMTYMGWVVKSYDGRGKLDYVGSPDIMVLVLPHLLFVVLPAILVTVALVAERGFYREHFISCSGKKEDDYDREKKRSLLYDYRRSGNSKFHFGKRWIRKVLLVVCLVICWKHFKVRLQLLIYFRCYNMHDVKNINMYGHIVRVTNIIS
jgi:hypothetical protein